jgi:hypothetical protein
MLGIAVGFWLALFFFGRKLPPDEMTWALICALVFSAVIILGGLFLLILDLETNDDAR